MLRLLIIIGFVCIGHQMSTASTLAIINDPDGYTNVRETPAADGRVTAKMLTQDVFWVDETSYFDGESNWVLITFIHKKSDCKAEVSYQSGYLFRNRIQLLHDLEEVPATTIDSSSIVFQNGKVKCIIAIDSCPEQECGYVANKACAWGVHDEKITHRIAAIRFIDIRQKRVLKFDQEQYADVLQPIHVHHPPCLRKTANNTYYLTMHNSDGGGYYEVVWVISNGKVVNRLIGNNL